MKLELKTPRLTIRNFTLDDIDAIIERTTQPEVARYMTWDRSSWAERERVENWLEVQRGLNLDTFGSYVEFAIDLAGKNIGGIGIKRISREHKNAELAWDLSAQHWGKGYATEAVQCFIDICFRTLDIHRIYAMCDARNVPSFRLMERLSMRREAHHQKSTFVKGKWIDELVYAVLKTEWLAKPKPEYTVIHSPYPIEMEAVASA